MPRKFIFILAIGGAVGLVLLLFLVVYSYKQHYKQQVYPGVWVGTTPLGGLTKPEVVSFIENVNNRLAKEGIRFRVIDHNGRQHNVRVPLVVTADSGGDLIHLDSEQAARQALAVGREGPWWQKLFEPLYRHFFAVRAITAPVVVDEQNMVEVLRGALHSFEDAPRDAAVAFTSLGAPTIVPEKVGLIINYTKLLNRVGKQLEQVSFESIPVTLEYFNPTMVRADLVNFLKTAPLLPNQLDIILEFEAASSTVTSSLIMSRPMWLGWLAVQRGENNQLQFGFNQKRVEKFLDQTIRSVVEAEPHEARFVVRDHRVEEFAASRHGRHLDTNATKEQLERAWQVGTQAGSTTTTITAVVTDVLPHFSTADVNDLGITATVGVGSSTFRDSHTNRIKNIAHAVERLNGILIKPGEEFSANRAAGPFTAENGFLPEMVIKGKEIKPEVGGGMCQIGTTLFRMAMNSGLPITQRRNHSLVVSYYADPVNGNPGTDATLYEPLLDFKFVNDTGNYLLLQTTIDYKKQQLTFTLWGKPDGRQGSYTHPMVTKWIPAGEPEEAVIDDGTLKPGEKKCQNAFRGAIANFTYHRVTPSGEPIDEVFTSYYRPLPKICMVGAAPASTSSTSSGKTEISLPTQSGSE